MIYGASTAETEKALRSYVLGFVEIEAKPIRDSDKASELGMQIKRDKGWADRWTYGIPVKRAWRTEEKLMISRIAFNSYRPEAGQSLAVRGAELDDAEVAEALKIKVREVNVFGETPVTDGEAAIAPFGEAFRPSRAFPGSKGERSSVYEDGDTYVYLAVYDGDGHAFLGRKKSFGDSAVVLKIGVSNDPKRRCAELNAGIPPAATGRWTLRVRSQAFSDMKSAEVAEASFKDQSSPQLESLGGEFFWGRLDHAETLCWKLPGMSRFRSK